VGAEVFYEDGWTDGRTDGHIIMMKLIVAFCYFANVPKNFHTHTKTLQEVMNLIFILGDEIQNLQQRKTQFQKVLGLLVQNTNKHYADDN
jgi:hypothetical protein